jgi:hypothetical protein
MEDIMGPITLTFLACWLSIVAAPGTPIAAALRRWLVDAPACRLSATGRAEAVIATVLVAAILAMTLLDDGDPLRMAVMGVPDAALWITSFELTAIVDVIVAVGVAFAGWRGGGMRIVSTAVVRHFRHRNASRARRVHRTARTRAAANDEDAAAAHPLAA